MSVTESDEKSTVNKKPAVAKKSATKKVASKKVVAKKIAKKAVVAKKTVRKKTTGSARATARPSQFSQRDRYEMIAKMAYFRAEKRGFEPGWEQQDWLESEKLIDEMLSKA